MAVGEKWMRWTFAEAGTKVASKMLQKVVGAGSLSFAYTAVASLIVGLVQVVAGFIVVKKQGKRFFPDVSKVVGACSYGLLAAFSTIVPFTIFYLGGEIGINTFIITLAIIPGALIDRFFFGHRLSGRQWFGLATAVFAGYSILGWPSVKGFFSLPLWVWLSFGVMMANAINQGITQKVKDIDPFVKNFWGGLVNVVASLGCLIAVGSLALLVETSPNMRKIWLLSVIGGCIVIAMWSFNLMSYKGGASIALKKVVMNGGFLIGSMVLGILIFGEKITLGKIIGIVFYFVAFALMDNGTWKYISDKFKKTPLVV